MIRRLAPAAAGDWAEARRLIEEYAAALGVDLSFQNFSRELDHLLEEYGPPDGAFLLAEENGVAVGCVGLRRFHERVGEIKRLYVVPAARGRGLARELALRIVTTARELGYARLVLDTLPSMVQAHSLYASLGFRPTEPYRFNPVPGTAYLALELR